MIRFERLSFGVTSIVLSLVLAAPFVGHAEESALPSGNFGLEVDFDVAREEGTFTCKAIVTDLDNGAVLSMPRVTSRIREEAQVRAGASGDAAGWGMNLVLQVTDDFVGYEFVRPSEVRWSRNSRVESHSDSRAPESDSESESVSDWGSDSASAPANNRRANWMCHDLGEMKTRTTAARLAVR